MRPSAIAYDYVKIGVRILPAILPSLCSCLEIEEGRVRFVQIKLP